MVSWKGEGALEKKGVSRGERTEGRKRLG